MPSRSIPFVGLGTPHHPDRRLNRRQLAFQARLREQPAAPIPQALADASATHAGYAFLRNPRVNWLTMLEPHFQETAALAQGQPLLILHDSSNIVHATAQQAEDTYRLLGTTEGYVLHLGLVFQEVDATALGLLNAETLDRTTPGAQRTNESHRWSDGALHAAKRLSPDTPRVHVMDREGDAYETFAALIAAGEDFLIRARGNRSVQPVGAASRVPLSTACQDLDALYTRTIAISARNKPAGPPKSGQPAVKQPARTAEVTVRARRVEVFRSSKAPKSLPTMLELSLVEVVEEQPPAGVEAVVWRLWTTLPVSSVSEVARVVSGYRSRWQVEDLFKALKTGCQFEKRRFESKGTSQRALGLYLPIAVHLLRLRGLARSSVSHPASLALSGMQLQVLRQVVGGLPQRMTARQALLAVAQLGGHLPSNGEPGWQVLGRGYETLDTMTRGWALAMQQTPENKGDS